MSVAPVPARKTAKSVPPCPICGAARAEPFTPFCSKRCADVDLHRWLAGSYVVTGSAIDGDEEGAEVDDRRR